MSRTLAVHLGADAAPLGTLRYDSQGGRESSVFQYDPTWLAAEGSFAIEPRLPLVAGPQFHRKVRDGSAFHAAIADTEPDGWARRLVQRDHARRRQQARTGGEPIAVYVLNAADHLLAADDASRVGALRFRDEEGRFQRAAEEERQAMPPHKELAQLLAATHAVETDTDTQADLVLLRGRGTSLGGMRPKCSVVDADGWLCVGKFPSVGDERAVTRGEVLALRLARKAGIDAAQARLVDCDGSPVALIRRFDRTGDGGRIPYVSAATMLGAEAAEDGEHSYTELADALRRHGSRAEADVEELWRRIAFSVLVTNVDDHLHNHGFLHAGGGRWQLAPAFDVNPFPDRARQFKTWVSEASGPEATVDALLSVTDYFGIAPARARGMLAEVEAVVATWRSEGRALGLTARDLDRFADAFEHRERQAARRATQ